MANGMEPVAPAAGPTGLGTRRANRNMAYQGGGFAV